MSVPKYWLLGGWCPQELLVHRHACNSEPFIGGVMIIVITSNEQDISVLFFRATWLLLLLHLGYNIMEQEQRPAGSILEHCFRVEHVECEQMFQYDNGKFFRVLQQMLQKWCGLIFSMSVWKSWCRWKRCETWLYTMAFFFGIRD